MTAYELAQGLIRGTINVFDYNNGQEERKFRVQRNGLTYEIEDIKSGHKAMCWGGMNNLIDFQGAASLLMTENRSFTLDKDGNFAKPRCIDGCEYKPTGGKWTPEGQKSCIDCGHTIY